MGSSTDKVSILGLPYAQRKFITVTSDVGSGWNKRGLESILRKRAPSKAAGHKGLQVVASAAAAVTGLTTSVGSIGTIGTIAGAVAAAPIAILGAAGLIGVAAVAFFLQGGGEEATVLAVHPEKLDGVRFPMGHPLDRVVYVGHPGIPSRYYLASNFHRLVFEHKLSEAVNLLIALGAEKIDVEHVTGWSSEFSTQLSAIIPTSVATKIEMGVGAGRRSSSGTKALLNANLRGNFKPALPDNLVWYEHEETWQSMANARLHHHLQQFELSLNYDDDFGVNASFQGLIENVGLNVGGKFQSHETTIWKLKGTFPIRKA
jgi:hypothetical protein